MDCSNPTPPSNGAVYSSTRMSYFGSRVSYTCQKGYSLIGNLEINNFVTDFNIHINYRITSFNSRVEELQILQVKLYLLPRKNPWLYSIFYVYISKFHWLFTLGSSYSTCSLPEQSSLPDFLLLLRVRFRADNNISPDCASLYRAELAAKFNASIRSLPRCSLLDMFVLDSSTDSTSGTEVNQVVTID